MRDEPDRRHGRSPAARRDGREKIRQLPEVQQRNGMENHPARPEMNFTRLRPVAVAAIAVVSLTACGSETNLPSATRSSPFTQGATATASPGRAQAATATPTPAPTPTATRAATPPPPPHPSVTFVNAPISARPGQTVTLQARTSTNTGCSILVVYKSGPSRAQGLGPKTSDAAGNVTWTWMVGTRTTPGSWRITVTCGAASGQTLIVVS